MEEKKDNKEKLEKIYLPEVVGNVVDPPKNHGRWENKVNLLENIAKDLPGERGTFTSIPSTWARALVFAEALADYRHPQHEDIKNEWRGLMGIFCFRECFGLKLDFTNLSFNPPTNRVTHSLFIQKPDGWPDQIYLLKVDDLLIGGSSPETLFFTPPEYECKKFIPWYKNGKLYDPLKYFDGLDFEKEKKILKMWIEKMIEFFQDQENASIVRLFSDWSGEMSDIQPDPSVYFESSNEGLPSPYDFVNLYFSWGNEEKSDFLLKVSDSRARNVKEPPIVVWERDGWDHGGRVFNSWHYLNFGKGNEVPEESSGKSLSGGRIQYPWIRPERLFLTDKILEIPTVSENQIPIYGKNTADKFKKGYIPPLKGEILNYLAPEDLKGRLNMEDAEGGGIKVTLTLPLTNGSSINIFKTYNQEDKKGIPDNILKPFEISPDFKRTGWNRYYCIYGGIETDEGNLDLEPEPWAYDLPQDGIKMHKIELKIPGHPESYFLWEISKFPEAIIYRYDGEECGINLLKSPRQVESRNSAWDVAIDLGTVNTVVFYRDGKKESKPIDFKDHCFQIINISENRRELFLIRSFFSPKDYPGGIFPTSFIKHPDKNGTLIPVIDGKALLGSPKDWFSWLGRERFFLDLLKDNLKWSKDPNEISCLYAYLKYLILIICIEAASEGVDRINLKWSYPSVFSEEMKVSTRDAFASLPDWVGNMQNAIDVTINEKDKQGETESVAVCRYLSDKEKSVVPRVIADIGGGTTDIGIWNADQIIFQTSILLAGKILTDYIQSWEDMQKDILFSLNVETENDETENDEPTKKAPMIEYFTQKCAHSFHNLINDHQQELYSLFTVNNKTNENKGYKQARSIIFITFAGITYYIGLVLKQIESPPVGIWLAGNGSKLINLVSPNAFPYLKRFLPAELTDIYINSADPDHTKQEVVRGVLSDIHFKTTPAPRVIIGEDGYKLGGKKVDFNQEITIDNLINNKIEVPEDYPQLNQFLKTYNECAKDLDLVSLEITKDLNLKIRGKMIGNINYLKTKVNPYQGLIQPFFAEELEYIIKETLYKKSKRSKEHV